MTYSAPVDICNLALSRLGVDKTITDLETEQSKEARNCRRFYAFCRDLVLQRVVWPFTVKVQALAPLADADLLPGWQYQYDHPSDCLSLLEVVPAAEVTEAASYYSGASCAPWLEARPARYRFRKALNTGGNAQVVLADIDDAYAVYSARVTEVGAYPVQLVDLIADRLAMELAMPLTVDPRYLDVGTRRYANTFVDAASRELEQTGGERERVPPSILARG